VSASPTRTIKFPPGIDPESYLRLPQILGIIPVSASTVWYWVRHGKFPKPIKLSRQVTVWKRTEVMAWLEARRADGGPGDVAA
jgi:predicted DNA-binding transcriptional regulator AlpA